MTAKTGSGLTQSAPAAVFPAVSAPTSQSDRRTLAHYGSSGLVVEVRVDPIFDSCRRDRGRRRRVGRPQKARSRESRVHPARWKCSVSRRLIRSGCWIGAPCEASAIST